jgi:hypothetical protein
VSEGGPSLIAIISAMQFAEVAERIEGHQRVYALGFRGEGRFEVLECHVLGRRRWF